MKKIRVYVAAPYTQGDVAINVANAINAGNKLIDYGYYPFVPHLSHFQHMLKEQPYEKWLEIDIEWLKQCNVLLRLKGVSNGADKEVEFAKSVGIPIVYSIPELLVNYSNE